MPFDFQKAAVDDAVEQATDALERRVACLEAQVKLALDLIRMQRRRLDAFRKASK